MDPLGSVLISCSFFKDHWTAESRGTSGILLSKDWVLTHGSTLEPLIDKSPDILDFVLGIKPAQPTLVPPKLRETLHFRVFRDESRNPNAEEAESNRPSFRDFRDVENRTESIRSDRKLKVNMREQNGQVVAVWKCPLLKETFEEFFVTWNFDEVAKFNRLLLPIFLLIRLDVDEMMDLGVPTIERLLSRFSKQLLEKPSRGTDVQIESTPFGNPIFIDSVARGVVSNVVGNEGCVIMTDANAFPGCEGGPVYIVKDCGLRIICGMVIAPLSWCRGEWVDYTFVANLSPCLREVLRKGDRHSSLLSMITDVLDLSVVVVRCGTRWGSGTLLDKSSGIFISCAHVVAEAPKSGIKIVLRRGKSTWSTWARLLYRSPEGEPYDVAVLRINPKDMDRSLRAIRLANDNAVRGEVVVSAGFPFFSSTQPTIGGGNVSRSLDCMLQTTCCVQSGSSGGPIVRRSTAEMLGMIVCNAISSNNSTLYPRLSMAVPVAVIRAPLKEYLRTGDLSVFNALTSNDATVRKTWKLGAQLPSKI